jgi:hypothetical protein
MDFLDSTTPFDVASRNTLIYPTTGHRLTFVRMRTGLSTLQRRRCLRPIKKYMHGLLTVTGASSTDPPEVKPY